MVINCEIRLKLGLDVTKYRLAAVMVPLDARLGVDDDVLTAAEAHAVPNVGRLADQVLPPEEHVQHAGHAPAKKTVRHAQNLAGFGPALN